MPGLVGRVTRMPRAKAEAELCRMVGTMRHAASYQTGTWFDESLGLYLGWSEREQAFSDGRPRANETGDLLLAFSGEDFPESDATRRLRRLGHHFDDDD